MFFLIAVLALLLFDYDDIHGQGAHHGNTLNSKMYLSVLSSNTFNGLIYCIPRMWLTP